MNDLRLGVIVPCRNESAVIARRLANLALEHWPAGEHRLLVVDDGSTDETLGVARRALRDHCPAHVHADCIANRQHAGKAGAIATALDELRDEVDLIVLTDADVVQVPGSFEAFRDAFQGEAALGMACGAQRFVSALAADGEAPAECGAGHAAALWDRGTAAVRRFESRRGRLFSVHGQLLAWRADLALRPRPGVAADDLDLILALRRDHPTRTARLVPGAVFHEQKPENDADAAAQATRRARAYVQALRANTRERGLQGLCYRYLPLLAPRLAVVVLLSVVGWSTWTFGVRGLAVCLSLLGVLGLTSVGRQIVRLLLVIERARRAEDREPLAAQWEMPR